MNSVGSHEAETHLSELLGRVEQGETITITRHGRPIARIVPADAPPARDVSDVVREFRAYSRDKGRTLGGLTAREMIEEGRPGAWREGRPAQQGGHCPPSPIGHGGLTGWCQFSPPHHP